MIISIEKARAEEAAGIGDNGEIWSQVIEMTGIGNLDFVAFGVVFVAENLSFVATDFASVAGRLGSCCVGVFCFT